MTLRVLIVALGLVAWIAGSTCGALVHRYSFDGDAVDAVGNADGVVVDPGSPSHAFVGGRLDLTANQGAGHQSTDAYVHLPANTVVDAFDGGVFGEMSLEFWVEPSEERLYASFFATGSRVGALVSDVATQAIELYPFGIHHSGDPGTFVVVVKHRNFGHFSHFIDPALPTGRPSHVVLAFKGYGNGVPTPTNPLLTRGDCSIYVDGALVRTVGFMPEFVVHGPSASEVWLGRPLYLVADPFFAGYYDEFRIYDNRLSGAEVARNYALGPDVLPEPTTLVWGLLGAVNLVSRAHRRALRVSAAVP
jgi:hypothetical protein